MRVYLHNTAQFLAFYFHIENTVSPEIFIDNIKVAIFSKFENVNIIYISFIFSLFFAKQFFPFKNTTLLRHLPYLAFLPI